MTIFDKTAVEEAAKAVMDNSGCTWDGICSTCKDLAVEALSAAEASIRKRGLMKEGFGWNVLRDGTVWAAGTEIAFCPDKEFDVTIIRKETP